MKIIGLTGGIASGKTSVAKMLKVMGAEVIDADQLARDIVTPGEEAYAAVIAEFGENILNPDKTLDRSALGKIVFADIVARRRLEAITHPAIRKVAELKLAALRNRNIPVVFYMAPLLIEAGI